MRGGGAVRVVLTASACPIASPAPSPNTFSQRLSRVRLVLKASASPIAHARRVSISNSLSLPSRGHGLVGASRRRRKKKMEFSPAASSEPEALVSGFVFVFGPLGQWPILVPVFLLYFKLFTGPHKQCTREVL